MKPAIVAKLSGQAADFYDTAVQVLGIPAISNVAPKNWNPHLQTKAAILKAYSQYLTAQVHAEADEYGLQVARLKLAVATLEDAKKRHLKTISVELQQYLNSFQAVRALSLLLFPFSSNSFVPTDGHQSLRNC
jgi:hypothetical protein